MSRQTMRELLHDVNAKLTPPEHDQAQRLASEARQKLATLYTQSAEVPAELHPFQAGTVTDEWIDFVLHHQANRERVQAASNVLKSFIKEAEGRAQESVPHSGALLAEYHKLLTQLFAETTIVVEQLNGADSADKAIAADRGTQWKQLVALADDYELLRDAQRSLMPMDLVRSASPSQGGDERINDLTVSNLDKLWPSWRQPWLTPGQTTHVSSGRVDRLEPWPEGSMQQFIWLVTSPAELWIPTVPELQSLWRRRRDRINETPKPLTARPDKIPTPQQFGGPGSMAESFIYGRLSPRITATESSDH